MAQRRTKEMPIAMAMPALWPVMMSGPLSSIREMSREELGRRMKWLHRRLALSI